MASCCTYRNPPRRLYSCSPNRCYRPCTPPMLCENGICRGVCKCRPIAPSCRPRSPCSPVGNVICEPEVSTNFVDAVNSIGPVKSRYESHMCPWEADVTVSGTIRAHCTSTADEISDRLAGPFKAYGRRYTTDSEYNWGCRESRSQKLSLGVLDDGGVLDFSKNNRPTVSDNLDYRVKRIMNSHSEPRHQKPQDYHKPSRDGHIHWDKHIDYDNDNESDKRYSRRRGRERYRDEEDKRCSSSKDFSGYSSQGYNGFEIMGNRRLSTNYGKPESMYKKENRYNSLSDIERDDHYHNTKGKSRDWRKYSENFTDEDDDDDNYHGKDMYRFSRKYNGAEPRGSGEDYHSSYRYGSGAGDRDAYRYGSGGGDRERRHRGVYEGDTQWARRSSNRDRTGEEKGGAIRFWPRHRN